MTFSGKGVNIWDTLTHDHPEYVEDRSNGDIAANSYYMYKEDVQLLKKLEVNNLYIICKFADSKVKYNKQILKQLEVNNFYSIWEFADSKIRYNTDSEAIRGK